MRDLAPRTIGGDSGAGVASQKVNRPQFERPDWVMVAWWSGSSEADNLSVYSCHPLFGRIGLTKDGPPLCDSLVVGNVRDPLIRKDATVRFPPHLSVHGADLFGIAREYDQSRPGLGCPRGTPDR